MGDTRWFRKIKQHRDTEGVEELEEQKMAMRVVYWNYDFLKKSNLRM